MLSVVNYSGGGGGGSSAPDPSRWSPLIDDGIKCVYCSYPICINVGESMNRIDIPTVLDTDTYVYLPMPTYSNNWRKVT